MVVRYRVAGSTSSDIAASVEAGVARGALLPGSSLPPVRALAAELGVNANTVAAAYRRLRDRGIVDTDGRRGTRVRERPSSTPRWELAVDVPPGVRDLSRGGPDPRLLPRLPRLRASGATYGVEDVHPGLGELAATRFSADGVAAGPVAVASSALDAIERLLAAHLRPGDAVAVEDPGWAALLDLLPAAGLRVEPVAVDDAGPRTDDVARALTRGARAVLLTSRAQNPTGAAVSAARARELRRVLRGAPDVLVVEDDHAGEVAGAPLQPVVGGTEHWAFVRSVGKVWGPDLRVAVLTGDPRTVDRVRGRLRLGPGWVSHLLQGLVAALWADPKAAATIERATRAYTERREALIDGLAEHGIPATGPSGLNVWVPVPDETRVVAALLQRGWAVAPGARVRVRSGPAVRVTVAELTPAYGRHLSRYVAASLAAPAGGGSSV